MSIKIQKDIIDQMGRASAPMPAAEEKARQGKVNTLLTLSAPILAFVGFTLKIILDESGKVSGQMAAWTSSLVLALAIFLGLVTAAMGYQKEDNVAMSVGAISSIVALVIIIYNALL